MLKKFLETIPEQKYYLELKTKDELFTHGQLNASITLDQLVQLVDIILLKKDGIITEVYYDEPGLFKFDVRNAIAMANLVKGYSPNGKFHRTMNLVAEMCEHEVSVATSIYQQRDQTIELLLPQCDFVDEKDAIAYVLNYLRGTCIDVSISDVSKIMQAFVFNKYDIPPTIVEAICANFEMIDINGDILYLYRLENGVSFLIGKEFCLTIYQPKVDATGSMLQTELLIDQIVGHLVNDEKL